MLVITTEANAVGNPIDTRYIAITEPAEPLTTPTISPATSFSILETRSALRINLSACFAPLIFLDAMAMNGRSSADVTAVPITSVIIPIEINTMSAISATRSPAESTNKLVNTDITTERQNEQQAQRLRPIASDFVCSFAFYSPVFTPTVLTNNLKKAHANRGQNRLKQVVIQQIDLAA